MRASYDTSRFTFANGKYIAEVSDFGNRPLLPNLGESNNSVLGRIYNDSIDIGLTLVNRHSRHEAKYYLESEAGERDNEDELTHWVLLPTSDTLHKYPQLAGTSIHLIND